MSGDCFAGAKLEDILEQLAGAATQHAAQGQNLTADVVPSSPCRTPRYRGCEKQEVRNQCSHRYPREAKLSLCPIPHCSVRNFPVSWYCGTGLILTRKMSKPEQVETRL